MTQSLNGSIETISHQVDRLTIQIDDSFDGFRNRYERPSSRANGSTPSSRRGVDWQTILEMRLAGVTGPRLLDRRSGVRSLLTGPAVAIRGRPADYRPRR